MNMCNLSEIQGEMHAIEARKSDSLGENPIKRHKFAR